MQTPKKSVSKNVSSEVPRRTSPITPRPTRQLNVTSSESDSTSLAIHGTKAPKNKSPKVAERKSPRSPIMEKTRLNRANEMETQITQLQEDLKKAKDQLASSETCKKQAELEAEEAKKQNLAATAKLEEVQQQIEELSKAEDARAQELCKIGQERDKAWQSELEAIQKQHSIDAAALLSATNEVQRLKQLVDALSNSEVTEGKPTDMVDSELQRVKNELAETIALIGSLKNQLELSGKSEEEYQILINQTHVQLEMAKTMIETLKSDGLRVTEMLDSTVTELKEYKARVRSLEETMRAKNELCIPPAPSEVNECAFRTELDSLNSEVKQLKTTLEEMEVKYNEEQVKCLMQIQSAYEENERIKIQAQNRESELQATIDEAKVEAAKLKECLIDKETLLQTMSDLKEKSNSNVKENLDEQMISELEAKFHKSIAEVTDLSLRLEDKETALNNVLNENELLKSDIETKECERIKSNEMAKAEIDKARSAEREALSKIEVITEEADKSSRNAAKVGEQLEAALAANLEMETELRRLRIQSDQWRKAAEAAAAILTSGNNGNLMDRTSSFGPDNDSLGGKLMNSPFSDEVDDESQKKRNNVLKKIGVLWKKGQK